MNKIYLKGIAQKADNGKYRVLASTSAVDRQGDSVDQMGWDLKNFLSNPVILWAHNYSELPVAKATDIKITDAGLECEFEFASAEGNPKAQQVKTLFEEGFLNAVSVGFIPKERKGNSITKSELLEISIVPVPANQEALRLAMSKGLDVSEIATELEKGEVSDIITEREVMEQKYGKMSEVWDIMYALSSAYFAEGVAVEDFSKLLTETVGLLTKIAGGESVEPTETETENGVVTDAFMAKHFGFESAEEKAGRVLSKKNRELIQSGVDSIKSVSTVLEELLNATDSAEDSGNGKATDVEKSTEVEDPERELKAVEAVKHVQSLLRGQDRLTEASLSFINNFLDKKGK